MRPKLLPLPENREAAVKLLLKFCGASNLGESSGPLRRCLEVAFDSGARTVVVEEQYVDVDFRSEHRISYARQYVAKSDRVERLHFFARPFPANAALRLDAKQKASYLGYLVLRRGIGVGPVGRTMIAPKADYLSNAVRTSVSEVVNFFGQPLVVSAVPFAQQDLFGVVCAHVAAWMCHYTSVLRGIVPRVTTGDMHSIANNLRGSGRVLPSPGLTEDQLVELLANLGLPPLEYRLAGPEKSNGELKAIKLFEGILIDAKDKEPQICPPEVLKRLRTQVARYMNSGIPVIVTTYMHSFVICGHETYRRTKDQETTYIVHDDSRGPYLRVSERDLKIRKNPAGQFGLSEQIAHAGTSKVISWTNLLAPIPPKIWLNGETVETQALNYAHYFSRLATERKISVSALFKEFQTELSDGSVALRTYFLPSSEYKVNVVDRISRSSSDTGNLIERIRMTPMSKYVWVTEFISRGRRKKGNVRHVYGEIVCDSTSLDTSPRFHYVHLPGVFHIDGDKPFKCEDVVYASGKRKVVEKSSNNGKASMIAPLLSKYSSAAHG
jgi:hypothetical protein